MGRLGTTAEVAGPGLDIELVRGAIDASEATQALVQIIETAPWRQDEITMFGKRTAVPRLTAWFGEPGAIYSYSGLTMDPLPWLPALLTIRTSVEKLAATSFNSVLVNLYRDGSDSMGWHSDDEKELGPEPVIASVSLGAARRFNLRRRDDTSIKQSTELAHGDVLIMAGPTQALWQHQIPKTSRTVGPRLNLTFRTVLNDA